LSPSRLQETGTDPLWVDPEEMRRIGYRTVDRLVDSLADPAARPPLRVASPGEMRDRLDGAPPAEGQGFDAILAELEEHVLPFAAHWGHPGYFAYFGVDAFRAAIDRSLDLAQLVERRVTESSELELLLPTSLGVTCFRRRFAGVHDEEELARLNAQLVRGLEESGLGLVSSTRLRGRYAIRLCVLNHTSTATDVERVLDWLEAAEVSPAPAVDAAADSTRDRHPDMGAVRLERIDVESLGALPLFSSLRDDQLERVARSARVVSVEAGDAIVRQWEAARDFCVIAQGTAEVRCGTEHLSDLGPGDFFGELAALDWGAGYGYPRLASVIATSPLVALVLSSDALNALMGEAPEVAHRVRAVVLERLPGL